MKIGKVFLSCLFAATSYAYADVIELDATNPDHCRQQLLKSTDELPVIAAYTSHIYDGNSKAYMKKFELLAKEHPERTFFKWDAEKDVGRLTQSLCLQQLGLFVPPSIMLIGVFNYNNIEGAVMTSPFRLMWAGDMTIEDMNKFIEVPDSDIKQFVLLRS